MVDSGGPRDRVNHVLPPPYLCFPDASVLSPVREAPSLRVTGWWHRLQGSVTGHLLAGHTSSRREAELRGVCRAVGVPLGSPHPQPHMSLTNRPEAAAEQGEGQGAQDGASGVRSLKP